METPTLEREPHDQLPDIANDEDFAKVVRKLSTYVTETIISSSSFEQLRTTSAGTCIHVLVEHIEKNVTHRAIVNALLVLKWHFSTLGPDDRNLNETRALACEIIAWRFLTRLSERDAVDYCLYELTAPKARRHDEHVGYEDEVGQDETSTLLPRVRVKDHVVPWLESPRSQRQKLIEGVTSMSKNLFAEGAAEDDELDSTAAFVGLNALEIAAVADAKKFLSQQLVQKIVYGIWTGEITFWESLSVHAQKKPGFHSGKHADPFSRLRVPKYIKAFEVLFFAAFLVLYYAVLVERNPYRITTLEVFLYIWLTAFAYDELSEFFDAGLFYYADFWSSWDLAIIIVGIAFFATRVVGLLQANDHTIDVAFDVLSLEALFLVPRICSLLSLHPYFGTLIPCLKEMTKDFIKFMAVVGILYIGFLTTFTLLARDHFTLSEMSWILVKVFFGSSYIGFDVMRDISPQLGPPLMIIFVVMTNILLITSLISILSNTFTKESQACSEQVYAHAREEYLFVYSIYVLEASTSNRLTHFYPPLNLIPLVFIRPLRLCVPSEHLRSIRILLLKLTHAPIVGAIVLYESLHAHLHGHTRTFAIGPQESSSSKPQQPSGSSRTRSRPQSGRIHTTEPATLGTSRPGSATVARINGEGKDVKSKGGSGNVEVAELQQQVEGLSAKIAELTALIVAQQDAKSP